MSPRIATLFSIAGHTGFNPAWDTAMETDQKIKNALFILRLGVFIVMFMWTLDKFINPEHAARVFETFYFISGAGDLTFYIIGFIQLIIIGAFVSAYKRQYSYLAVLIMHALSTLRNL